MERLDVPDQSTSKTTSPIHNMLPNANSALMSRLSAFMPKMEEANKSLASAKRIDEDMIKLANKGDDSDSDDSDSDSEPKKDAADDAGDSGPQIELTVAMGDFGESLLAKMEDGDPSQVAAHLQKDGNDDGDGDGDAKSTTKSFLKRELAAPPATADSDSASPKKKPLIEFVDDR